MPESPAKRKFSVSQTTLSCSRVGLIGAAHAMRSAGMPVSAASRAMHASLSVGSALNSENTAPDSTAASWSLSPSRMMRAEFGTASRSFVASARSSIDASSTTSRSIGSGLPAWWRKSPESGSTPSRRWTVNDSTGQPFAQLRGQVRGGLADRLQHARGGLAGGRRQRGSGNPGCPRGRRRGC